MKAVLVTALLLIASSTCAHATLYDYEGTAGAACEMYFRNKTQHYFAGGEQSSFNMTIDSEARSLFLDVVLTDFVEDIGDHIPELAISGVRIHAEGPSSPGDSWEFDETTGAFTFIGGLSSVSAGYIGGTLDGEPLPSEMMPGFFFNHLVFTNQSLINPGVCTFAFRGLNPGMELWVGSHPTFLGSRAETPVETPEPASLLLLAAGIPLLRRRRY